MNVRNLLLGAFAVISLSLTACGGGFSCSDKGSCANDAAPAQAAIDACNAAVGDSSCGSQYKDMATCAKDNATCDANGHSTVDASKCSTQLAALLSCCQSNPTSKACPGS